MVKKYTVFIVLTLMIIIVGCQSKEIRQKDNTISSSQNISSSAPEAASNSSTSVAVNQKTEGVSGSNGEKTTAAAGNTSNVQKNKSQTSTSKTASKPEEEQKQPEPGSFTLLISKNRGVDEVFKEKILIQDNKSLMDYLRDNVSIKDEGGFIKSIEGINSVASKDLTPEQKSAGIIGIDWFIFQNETKTKSGANDIIPKSGDIINLDYREWTYKDMAP